MLYMTSPSLIYTVRYNLQVYSDSHVSQSLAKGHVGLGGSRTPSCFCLSTHRAECLQWLKDSPLEKVMGVGKVPRSKATEARRVASDPLRGSELGTNSICYGRQRGRKFLLPTLDSSVLF